MGDPALGLGPTLVHALFGGGGWDALLLYIVGPLAGAWVAAMVFGVQEGE